MPAPLERDRQYTDKFLGEEWNFDVDFTGRLSTGVLLAATGHAVQWLDINGNDVTATICNASTLAPDATLAHLLVQMKPTLTGTEGTYRGLFTAKLNTVALDFEVMEVWIRIRSR